MKPLFLFLVLMAGSLYAQAQRTDNIPNFPPFEHGETIVFLGNSITQGGLYHTFVKLFYLTRFPERKINFVNAGIAGNQAFHAIERFETDVMVHQPDHIILMFGMNDMGFGMPDGLSEKEVEAKMQERLTAYAENMHRLTAMVLDRGIKLSYLVPSIYDDKVKVETPIRAGGNTALALARESVYELAQKYGAAVVDFYTIMNEVNAHYQAEDPTFTVVGKDRVHPGEEGHLLMAYQFLKAQQLPAMVSEVVIDAADVEVDAVQNAKVTYLRRNNPGYLYFSVKADALPFPVEGYDALDWVPLLQEFNREVLRVINLPAGSYRLTVGETEIGTFRSGELQEGLNLAAMPQTPQYQQALMVKKLVMAQQELIKSKTRATKLMEYGILKDLPQTAPQELLDKLFAEELAKIEGKSYYPYIKTQTENYQIYRPLYRETEAAIDRYEQSMRLLVQPLTLKYLLEKVD